MDLHVLYPDEYIYSTFPRLVAGKRARLDNQPAHRIEEKVLAEIRQALHNGSLKADIG